MIYRYKNFVTKYEVMRKDKQKKREMQEIILFLLIINLVLFSIYSKSSSAYGESLNKKNSLFIKNKEPQKQNLEEGRNIDKLSIMKDKTIMEKCSSFKYENNKIKFHIKEENLDYIVDEIRNCKELYIDSIDMTDKDFIITLGVKQ